MNFKSKKKKLAIHKVKDLETCTYLAPLNILFVPDKPFIDLKKELKATVDMFVTFDLKRILKSNGIVETPSMTLAQKKQFRAERDKLFAQQEEIEEQIFKKIEDKWEATGILENADYKAVIKGFSKITAELRSLYL